MSSRPVCVITGIGAVSALGPDVRSLRDAIFAGRDGIVPVTRFDTSPFAPVHLGGCVHEPGGCEAWAVSAALEAWREAAIEAVVAERVAVVAGTTEGEEGRIPGVARAVAEAIGARGAQWTVSTACTSSANAIGLGCDLIARGDADVVVAGGAERLVAEMYAGFYRLGVLAVEKCAPFGETRGTTLGEGAGFVVLERAGARERRAWAYVSGYGLASDAWHETSPEPRGEGIARAMRGAMIDAGLAPEAIGYVNAHATGTAANDDAEWRGVQKALGAHAGAIPISGSKSFFGHAQGAAGVLELLATIVCMREGAVPHTLRVGRGRNHGPPDPVAGDAPRSASFEHALGNSAAFGGANAVVCVSRAPAARAPVQRVVRVAGVGVSRTEAGAPRDEAAIAAQVPEADLRSTDPSARLALAASSIALADAGVRVRGALRERAGIFAGSTRVSPASAAEYRDSVERGGLGCVSVAAFARLVLHAPAGAVSRLLSLRGPTTTLCDDAIAGLLAFAYAADHLARREDADVILACGFDERASDEACDEGAACAVLSAAPDARGPIVAGVACAGPGALERAIDVALERAGRSRDDVDAWKNVSSLEELTLAGDGGGRGEDARRFATLPSAPSRERQGELAPSLRSALAVVDAARALREGARVAVAAGEGPSASCAVVLVASG